MSQGGELAPHFLTCSASAPRVHDTPRSHWPMAYVMRHVKAVLGRYSIPTTCGVFRLWLDALSATGLDLKS
eukprot:3299257-Prymnesium_polylepis.1